MKQTLRDEMNTITRSVIENYTSPELKTILADIKRMALLGQFSISYRSDEPAIDDHNMYDSIDGVITEKLMSYGFRVMQYRGERSVHKITIEWD